MSKVEDKWQSLGFKRKPFIDLSRVNPFLTPKQRQQLKLLEELVREGGHLLLLLGVSGVGKTTFLNALKKNIALPNTEVTIGVCEIEGDQGVSVAMIKALLVKHLAIEDTADVFLPTLGARLAQLTQSNQRFLLIIDDAHELPAETVRFILDVISELDETEHSLSVLLAGRLQLEHLCVTHANVNMDWNTGSSFTVILQPLNEEEVINYIKHGLRQAGYRGVMPFSKAQLIELSQAAKGILARLMVMAVDILETKRRGIAPSHSIMPQLGNKVRAVLKRNVSLNTKTSKNHKALIAAVLSVMMLSVGWWFYLEGPAPTAVDVSQGKVISVEKEGSWVKTVVKLDGNARRMDVAAPATPVIHSAAITASVANTIPVANEVPITNDVPITTPIANDKPVAVALATQPSVVKTPAVAAKPEKKNAPAVSFKAQGYTIQIAGGTDLSAVQKTVCQLWTSEAKSRCAGLPTNLHYVHTLKNDQDWYIATLGQYSSSAEARAALQQLPVTVQKNTPWVRAFAQIPNVTVVASN